jgi:hypothetical protein
LAVIFDVSINFLMLGAVNVKNHVDRNLMRRLTAIDALLRDAAARETDRQ